MLVIICGTTDYPRVEPLRECSGFFPRWKTAKTHKNKNISIRSRNKVYLKKEMQLVNADILTEINRFTCSCWWRIHYRHVSVWIIFQMKLRQVAMERREKLSLLYVGVFQDRMAERHSASSLICWDVVIVHRLLSKTVYFILSAFNVFAI